MKLAVVDIGSNAIRFQVSNVLVYQNQASFKKYEYIRFPIRLGEDVFNTKEISPEKETKFIKIMEAFKLLFEIYEVEDYMICATSAMRESKNGYAIAEKVKNEIGLEIQIIDGLREAELINNVLINSLADGAYVHIDVGGGSTEINVYSK
ncbi:MAG: phosphatase, partial [Cytophagales bacterium]|nr:phosphatase [Cytophagales bacterium]